MQGGRKQPLITAIRSLDHNYDIRFDNKAYVWIIDQNRCEKITQTGSFGKCKLNKRTIYLINKNLWTSG